MPGSSRFSDNPQLTNGDLKRKQNRRRRPLLMTSPLLLGLIVLGFVLPGRHLLAQKSGERVATGNHEAGFLIQDEPEPEASSDASCSQVSYRLREGEATETAADTSGGDNDPVSVTPPNPDGPTLVDLGLFIIQVTEINEVDNTFMIEGFMDLVWCDPRLAFNPEAGIDEQVFLEENAADKVEEIWWPDITFVNDAGPPEIDNEVLIIYADGTVDYEEKFSAVLEARYDLRRFPFDKEILEIEIESFAWPHEYLVFHQEEEKIGFSHNFEIPEWHTVAVETRLDSKQEVRDRSAFSEFIMEIEVERQSGF